MNAPHDAIRRGAVPLMLAAALGCALLLKPVQGRIDRLNAALPPIDPDLVYFSSPAVVKALAMGYVSLIADVYWMRTIQYYGRRDEAARRTVRYKNLQTLLDITTTLDPMLLQAYRAGSLFLSEPDPVGAGQPKAALRLLDKAIAHHPQDWRLYFDKGFVHFWFEKDSRKAGETWLAASRLPDRPVWIEGLAAMALSRGGAIETARTLWQHQYRESDRADVRENAKNHLESMQVNEDLWTLEFYIARYRQLTGALPASVEDLVRSGLIRRIPADPSGVPYAYDRSAGTVQLGSRSRVRYLSMPYDYREAFMAGVEKNPMR